MPLLPGVLAVEAAVLGADARMGRFLGECRPSVRQVLGVDVSGLLVDQQGAGPTALLAVRTAGQAFRESALPLRAGRIAACPAVGCMLRTLPLRAGTVSARQASARGVRSCITLEVGEDGEHPAVGVVSLGESELGEDVANVLADGRLRDEELAGDGGVGVSLGDEGEDLTLAR